MEFICYRKCGTCAKAKKYLLARGEAPEEREITEQPLALEELQEIHARSGLPIKGLLNTSGLVYRELEMKEKVKTHSEEEILQLLAEHPMLVKRPVLRDGDRVLVGFKEGAWEQHFEEKGKG